MLEYDPHVPPDPVQWLALGEARRFELVEDYHERMCVEVGSMQAHVATHVAVESQLALGDPPMIRAVLERLMAEGLDRHNAVHAIGSQLIEVMHDLVHKKPGSTDVNRRYQERLGRLTRARWEHGDEA